jgi:glycosyltransferase involved in cell wall biosynthesis
MPARRTIVCFSSQRWDDPLWTNKQHIMSRLGEQHRVLYVDFGAQGAPGLWLRQLGQRKAPSLRRPAVTRNGAVEVVKAWAPHVASLFPHGHQVRVHAHFDARVRAVGRLLESEGVEDAIIWVYHPGYGSLPGALPHRLLVYDCVDEYSAFPAFRDSATWIAERERALCAAADLVFCTSRSLFEAKSELAPGRCHLVHNVGDAAHFETATAAGTEPPADIRNLPRPIIGFVGAVSNYKLDLDWLEALARARPGFSIVLIGPVGTADPTTDVSRLRALPNVHLLGHRDYSLLPRYAAGFDVAVIPYRINAYTRSVFPIKFFELLATGRPLVISALPALEDYFDAVEVARDAEDFVAACERALGDNDAGARARRLALARENSWPARVGRLMTLIEAELEPGG